MTFQNPWRIAAIAVATVAVAGLAAACGTSSAAPATSAAPGTVPLVVY